jgi:hypothetical protein
LNHIFFWDTIQLGSEHANFFYTTHFTQLILPDSIDSGHIPTFGFFLAIVWFIFGKTLVVSHLFMLPFVLGIVWQSYVLLKQFIPLKFLFISHFLFLIDPTLLSQITLISPDVVLVFFFLIGLNAVLKNHRYWLMVSLLGLFAISMRGMMVSVAILSVDIYLNTQYTGFKAILIKLLRNSFAYIPALVLFISYFGYHYYIKGWIGYHNNSPWAPCFARTNTFSGLIYNIGILGWRILDFGRVFIWITMIYIVSKFWRRLYPKKEVQFLLFVFLIITICLSISVILYKGLSGHRYLLPVYLTFILFSLYIVITFIKNKIVINVILSIWAIGLLTGNLWVYPDKIAKGWDSTLAHIPYYNLRDKMVNYIKKEKIPQNKIGSGFPICFKTSLLDLSNDTSSFVNKNLDKDQYILYSNIFNNFSDYEIDELHQKWKLVYKVKSCQVYMSLYKRQP